MAIFTSKRKDGHCESLKIHINNIIQTPLQFIHVVCIPLHHFSSPIHRLSMIIRSPDRILINMGKLCLNPGRVIALFMQNCAYYAVKTRTHYKLVLYINIHWVIYFCIIKRGNSFFSVSIQKISPPL